MRKLFLSACFAVGAPVAFSPAKASSLPADVAHLIDKGSYYCIDDGRLFGQDLIAVSRTTVNAIYYDFEIFRVRPKEVLAGGAPSGTVRLNFSLHGECLNDASSVHLVSCFRDREFGEPYSSRVVQKTVMETFIAKDGLTKTRDLVEFEIVSPLAVGYERYLRFSVGQCALH